MTLFYFLIVFTLLVFVHEFGHFISAKKLGIAVHEFGFGFPPRIISKLWRGTRYSINVLPLGGFVRIKGEEGENSEDVDSFSHRSLWQKSIVVFAGVAMNVILGWALLTGTLIVGAPSFIDATTPESFIRNPRVIIRSILPHAPATTIDVRVEDTITQVDGENIFRVQDLQSALQAREGQETRITVKRGEEMLTRSVTPRYIPEAERVGIGVGLDEIATVRYPFFIAIAKGTMLTGRMLRDIVVGFFDLFRNIIIYQRVSVDLSGPIGIAVLTGQIARRGLDALIQFTAVLSLNLAVLNILPVPALDGGRLLFFFIEKIRGSPIKRSTEALIHRIGFAALLLLVLLVTYKDITRLFT